MGNEYNSYKNPLRFYTSGANSQISYENGNRAFKNQIPGYFVSDALGATYKCTKYKTQAGEPVWAKVDAFGETMEVYAVLVNAGKKPKTGTEASAVGSTGVKYNSPTIKNRLSTSIQVLTYDKAWGSFFFMRISDSDRAKITGEPANTGLSTISTTTSDNHTSAVVNSIRAQGELYDFLKFKTNGRSGPGATGATGATGNTGVKPPTPAQIQKATDTDRFNKKTLNTLPAPPKKNNTPGSPSKLNSSSKNTKSGQTKPANDATRAQQTTVNITYKPDMSVYTGSSNLNKPYLKQVINSFDFINSSRQRIERIHVFDLIPNSFEFSQLSSEWSEVDRSGNYSLVDWSKYNLTKVTFRFLVTEKRVEQAAQVDSFGRILSTTKNTLVNDGLLVSVDAQLDNIRAIAGAPEPITLYNLNSLLTTSFRYPYVNNTRNIKWIIADASITATRLTQGGGHISAAEVSMTLTEYPVTAREIVPLPPLKPDTPPPPPCKPGTGDKRCTQSDPTYGLWVENTFTFLQYATDNIYYGSGKST